MKTQAFSHHGFDVAFGGARRDRWSSAMTCRSWSTTRACRWNREVPEKKWVRFRTLGCYPLTCAVESKATTLPEIIQEMRLTRTSERSGRAIDHEQAGSMEKKKCEGYF